MRKRIWISRIIFYVLIPGIFVFALLVQSSLKQDIPLLSNVELMGFQRTVKGGTADMLTRRGSALKAIAGRETVTGAPIRPSTPLYGYSFDAARSRMSDALTSDWVDEGTSGALGYKRQSREINSMLDTADEMYLDWIKETTVTLEDYLTESVNNRRDDYISYIGYRKLVNTMGRDIIRYKDFNSLKFHEFKTEYYRSRMLAARADLDLASANAEVQGKKISDSILEDYTQRLSVLADDYFETINSQNNLVVDINRDLAVLDLISDRVYGLDARDFQLQTDVSSNQKPTINRQNWIDIEEDFNYWTAVLAGL